MQFLIRLGFGWLWHLQIRTSQISDNSVSKKYNLIGFDISNFGLQARNVNFFLMFCFIYFLMIFFPGKGDLVGCDISKHLAASSSSGSCPEVIVKSSCDVRALTYCDLKCLNIPGRNLKPSILYLLLLISSLIYYYFLRWKKIIVVYFDLEIINLIYITMRVI
jgi:hypothetical protein